MNRKDELISVVVPVFKVEKYLDKCILSIINQTYKNLEIILVNDGSPDNCPEICERYAKGDSRIKVVHKINGGLSSARNAGLDIATGKYVTFVDSDDSISEEYIKVLYETLKTTSSQISVGNILIVKSEEFEKKEDPTLNESIIVFSSSEAVLKMYDYGKNLSLQFVTVWGNLYEMGLFESLRFPIGKINEDQFLNYRLFFRANNISYTTKEIYFYLKRENSIMQSEYSLINLSILECFEERILFFEDNINLKILNKTLYIYFHCLLFHITKLKLLFPEEVIILESLNNKFYCLTKKLIKNYGLNKKERIIIIFYYFFPKFYKYRF